MADRIGTSWNRTVGDTLADRAGMIAASFLAGCLTILYGGELFQRPTPTPIVEDQLTTDAAMLLVTAIKNEQERTKWHTAER